MSFVPPRFLFRLALPCLYAANVPNLDGDELLGLTEAFRIDNFAALDGKANFADVRLGWNDAGLALQLEVRGKEQLPVGDVARVGQSDGLTLWLDTRDARTSHRASRFCHQFHFLVRGGGAEGDEPAFLQTKIHRALHDAPLAAAESVPMRVRTTRGGYVLEVFLTANVLMGYDPEQNPRLGLAYMVRDRELGEQILGPGSDFPMAEDPTLWTVLELVREKAKKASRKNNKRSGRE